MPPPAPTAANCLWSPTSSSFAPTLSTCLWMAARAGLSVIADSSTTTRSPARSRPALVVADRLRVPAASAGGEPVLGGQPARHIAGGEPLAARTSERGFDSVASPNTRPAWSPRRSGSVQARARAPTTNDLPVPAGPMRVSTRAPEVSTPRTADAWSTPSSMPCARSWCRNRCATSRGSAAASAWVRARGHEESFGAEVVGVQYSCAPEDW